MPLPTRIASALADGETVVTSSARAARALRRLHGEAQRALGLAAWKSADILDWDSWLNRLWQKQLRTGKESRLLLSHAQEHQVWAQVVAPAIEGKLLISVLGVSELAQEAYALLCDYGALSFLRGSSTDNPDVDFFRGWALEFEQRCSREQWLSRSRLALELHDAVLKSDTGAQERLLLTGFDRTTPAQNYLLEACSERGQVVNRAEAAEITAVADPLLVQAVDRRDEVYTCALWVKSKLAAGGLATRIAVVAANVSGMRPDIERIFREVLAPQAVAIAEREAPLPFEFSLGVPLAATPMARAALLLLRWFSKSLPQEDANWLMLSGFLCTDTDELLAMARFDAKARQEAMPQPEQGLDTLLQALNKRLPETQPLEALRDRLWRAKRRVSRDKILSFAGWAKAAEDVLQIVQWPGAHPLQSEEFQVLARWSKVLDTVATLSFQGSDVTYAAFLEVLELQARRTIFAPESNDAPIQILGPLEAAGLTFDALWFLGADDASWPVPARPHPFLPRWLQREKRMPHGSSDLDFELAQLVTRRLQSGAGQYVFSYSAQNAEGVCRPSTLLDFNEVTPAKSVRVSLGEDGEYGAEHDLPKVFDDQEQAAVVPWPVGQDAGGSDVLRDQAACAFRSFAKRRLQARAIDEKDWGLGPMDRGNVVHTILENFWTKFTDRAALVTAREEGTLAPTITEHVTGALQKYRREGAERNWNQAYLDAESRRITSLIEQWLAYEEGRANFVVKACEQKQAVTVGELKLRIRVDRIDEVAGGDVIIDYKTGAGVKTGVWEGKRPSEPQLPIYASYGNVQDLQGVLLAKVVPDKPAFVGRVTNGDAIARKLVSEPFSAETAQEWREVLLELAEQFLRGEAQVDPKDYPNTCKFCDLPGLCRIAESDRAVTDEDGDEAGGESGG